MEKFLQFPLFQGRNLPRLTQACLICAICLWAAGCNADKQIKIAVIPQTDGTMLWEPAHRGAEEAAAPAGIFVYWDAPTREDDIEAQIALVNHVVDGKYQGLVLAPDQALALITPVRRALSDGIPTVIVGSPLLIPAGGNLSYIVNNDIEGGKLAADRVADLIKGHGTVAVLGINSDITGIMIRARAFEQILARDYPDIRIVEKRMGSFNVPHEQQVAEDTLRSNPNLDVIVALTSTSTDGVLAALDTTPEKGSVKVIGFDSADSSGSPPFYQKAALDSVIQQDTRSMGQQAIELIHARLLGQSVPALIRLHPKLITRENVNSPEIREMLSMDFTLGRWHWSTSR